MSTGCSLSDCGLGSMISMSAKSLVPPTVCLRRSLRLRNFPLWGKSWLLIPNLCLNWSTLKKSKMIETGNTLKISRSFWISMKYISTFLWGRGMQNAVILKIPHSSFLKVCLCKIKSHEQSLMSAFWLLFICALQRSWHYTAFLLQKKMHILHTVYPRIVSAETILFWIWPYVLWPLLTVHKIAETIQGRKLYE